MIKLQVEQKKLNPEQKRAVEFGDGPLLIIAGAGTGKTTVITERIKHLITSGRAKPAQILALTFTEKAAREMEERVDQAMPYGYTQMWISTFHSFCDRVLRAEAIHIGLNPGYRLLGDAEATLLVRQNLFSFDLKYFRPLGNPNKFITGMLQHFSRLKDEDVSPDQYFDWVKSQNPKPKSQKEANDVLEHQKCRELATAYKAYEELKIKEGLIDFSDLIANVLELFRTRPNVLQKYQQQFKYFLVDEFQDTNVAQNELILLLVGKKQNITVVADDDQSIYKFRGAAVSNVLSFRKRVPKLSLVVLTKNYRSTQEILDKSYTLIQHNNPDRLEVKEGIDKKLVAERKAEIYPLKFFHADRVENEAEAVVKEIKKLTVDSSQFTEKNGNYTWKDIAILVRANSHAEPFVRALIRYDIPFQFLGPGKLFHEPEIIELVAYLRVLANFQDSTAVFKVLTMEYFHLPVRDLIAISNFAKKNLVSLFEACEIITGIITREGMSLPLLDAKTLETLERIIKMVRRHIELTKKETAGQLLYYFLEDSGLLKHILDYSLPLDPQKAANITKFFNRLKTYEAEHEDASVTAVLDWLQLAMELGESPLASDTDWSENDAVNLLTIHGSKGLEFRIVFLVNLVSQRFPTTERSEQIPIPDELIKEELPIGDYHEEEERRLFYVGMTRAQDRLYLTAANYYGEGKREKKISPFVYETLGDVINVSEISFRADQLSLLDWKKVELQRNLETSPAERTSQKIPITYLSYSQIETFRNCPLHYRLKYILKVPTPPSAALSFGMSVHAALRDFYRLREQEKVNKKLLMELLEKNWQKEGYANPRYEREMWQRGVTYLSDYFTKEYSPKTKVLLTEQPFIVSLQSQGRRLKIGGQIDRIDDLGGGKIEIIDYKTGRLPSKREIDASMQLSIYALAASEIPESPFKRSVDSIKLTMYFFDSQECISTMRTREQLEEEKLRLFGIAREIETSDFRCSKSQLCRNCEYSLFCNAHE